MSSAFVISSAGIFRALDRDRVHLEKDGHHHDRRRRQQQEQHRTAQGVQCASEFSGPAPSLSARRRRRFSVLIHACSALLAVVFDRPEDLTVDLFRSRRAPPARSRSRPSRAAAAGRTAYRRSRHAASAAWHPFSSSTRQPPCRLERARVLLLMVLRDEGGRHEQRRTAEHAQLAERRRTCAAHDKVGRRHAVRHVVDVFGVLDIRVVLEVRALLARHFSAASRAPPHRWRGHGGRKRRFCTRARGSRPCARSCTSHPSSPQNETTSWSFSARPNFARAFSRLAARISPRTGAPVRMIFSSPPSSFFRLLEADEHAVCLFSRASA